MSKTKILIVDDDARISSLMRTMLEPEGYEVCEENRSFAALATAREFRPHIALLDVDMPGKDGGMVAAEFKKDALLASTPIVFVSSLVTKGDEGVHYGIKYLCKPVDPQLLLDTVRSHCRQLQPEASA